MLVSFLQWLFGLNWWHALKDISSVGAPIVCVVGLIWYAWDRFTGGV